MSDISAQIKRALITGITGSGGSYLAEYIVQNHPGVSEGQRRKPMAQHHSV